jgi:hypothetical protein
MGIQEEQHNVASHIGSLDGDGAGDHDQAYRFGPTSRAWRPASGALGWRPRASAPYPFNTRQFIRLLVMRGRFHDHLAREGEDVATSWPKVAA